MPETKNTRRAFLRRAGETLVVASSAAPAPTRSQTVSTRPPAAAQNLIKPPMLRRGDTIGVITPSTYVSDPDRLALVGRTLEHFGLRVKMGRHAGARMNDYRASVGERVDDLHEMFRDPDVRGIFCLRGGYGAQHLLDRVDYDLIRRHPKVFVGYSDITALHLAIHRRSRLVTFHGPVVLSDFTAYTEKHFRRALFESAPLGPLTNPPEGNRLRPEHNLRVIRGGRASGPLTGGNLTLISTTLGTPYEIETRGRVLFLEDVDEEPYSIDRMLTQLRLAGKLDEAAAIVFGECASCEPRKFEPSTALPYSFGEVLNNLLGDLRVPVLFGLTFGHTGDQLTLPLGLRATLDADRGTLEIHESGVI